MNSRKSVLIISLILFVILSLMFFAVKINALFIFAYGFAIIAINLFAITMYALINNRDSHPCFVSISMYAWSYLLTNIVFSAAFVLRDQLYLYRIPTTWFLVIHVVLLGFFATRIVLLYTGSNYIAKRGRKVRPKVTKLRMMQTRIDSMKVSVDDQTLRTELGSLSEKIKFSDPMSSEEVSGIEDKMEALIVELQIDVANRRNLEALAKVSQIDSILEQRNAYVKALK